MSTLYHIKLSNGEELIAELMPATSATEYKLKNPMIIQDVVDPSSGVTAIVLVDYAPFNNMKNSIYLNKSQVISTSVVDTEMSAYYKASLEYSVMYGHKDSMAKIQRAADNLSLFTKSRTLDTLAYTTQQETEEYFSEEDLEEQELDDFFSDQPTSNTTIH
jgi:hypothetical protein